MKAEATTGAAQSDRFVRRHSALCNRQNSGSKRFDLIHRLGGVVCCAFSFASLAFASQPISPGQLPTPEIQRLVNNAHKLAFKERLAALEKLLPTAQALKDRPGEALILVDCGSYAVAMGHVTQALEFDQRAIDLYRRLKDRHGEAGALTHIGAAYDELGQLNKALECFNLALSIAKEIGDSTSEARTLNSIGDAYFELGKLQTGLDNQEQALRIATRVADKGLEANILNDIGVIYATTGQNPRALEYFERALPIERAVGDHQLEASTLCNIGAIQSYLGRTTSALKSYDQALQIAQASENRKSASTTLDDIGVLDLGLGQMSAALKCFQQSLAIKRQIGDQTGVETALANIGLTYRDLGLQSKALDNFKQALSIEVSVGDKVGQASTLTNIGLIFRDLGQPAKALDYYTQALPVEKAVGDEREQGDTMHNIGSLYIDLGQLPKALAYLQQALAIRRRIRNRGGEGATLTNLGTAFCKLGEPTTGVSYYLRALAIDREVGDRRWEALTFERLSIASRTDQPSLAIWYGKRAVNLYQSLRRDISTLDKTTQSTYRESVARAYRGLADLLAKQGRLGEAEQVLRLLKDDELYEYLRRSDKALAGGKAEYTAAESAWDKAYEAETKELADEARQAEELRKNQSQNEVKLSALMTKLDQGESRFQHFLDRVLEKSRVLNAKENRIERVRDAQSITDTLAVLPAGTVAVYALALPDALRLFYFAPGTSVARVSNIKAEDLNRKVLAFREALTDPTADPRPLGKVFYDLLIKPIEIDLAGSRAKRIMWSLDGMLRYIPIGALYDGKRFVVERYDVSVFTPAGSARLEREPKTSWKALAAGVSLAQVVKDDDGSLHRFDALAGVRTELAGVVRSMPGSTELLDRSFTLDHFKNALNRRPQVVHLATHFSFRAGDETRSYLLTGDGKPLRVADARSLSTLSFQGVSLLTLSACETALGGGDGSEVEGISAVLQNKGAEAVVATLWSVADSSTAGLMAEFYRLRKKHEDWSKLHALQEAQIELLRGQLSVKHGPTRSEGANSNSKGTWPKTFPAYSHPFYWAPFVLMGNWK